MIRTSILVIVATLLAAADGKPDPKWLDTRITAKARANIDTLVGKPLPLPADTVRWFGGEAPKLPARGRVTLIQCVAPGGGKAALERVARALPDGVLLVGLHGAKRADRAEKEFAAKCPCPVAIDAAGTWTAALHLPETPTNILIDPDGVVRLCGIRSDALKSACEWLLAPAPAPATEPPRDNATFPPPTGAVKHAIDQRGKAMPAFAVDEWITPRPPKPDGKLLVIDFWATWCGPCVASIPHMNDLATKFADIAQCVGVSDEPRASFQQGMARIGKSAGDFKYALALAPSKEMYGFFGVQAIPHCVIVSSDGVVRWQGHPATLTEDIFRQFAEAQRALNVQAGAGGGKASGG